MPERWIRRALVSGSLIGAVAAIPLGSLFGDLILLGLTLTPFITGSLAAIAARPWEDSFRRRLRISITGHLIAWMFCIGLFLVLAYTGFALFLLAEDGLTFLTMAVGSVFLAVGAGFTLLGLARASLGGAGLAALGALILSLVAHRVLRPIFVPVDPGVTGTDVLFRWHPAWFVIWGLLGAAAWGSAAWASRTRGKP